MKIQEKNRHLSKVEGDRKCSEVGMWEHFPFITLKGNHLRKGELNKVRRISVSFQDSSESFAP